MEKNKETYKDINDNEYVNVFGVDDALMIVNQVLGLAIDKSDVSLDKGGVAEKEGSKIGMAARREQAQAEYLKEKAKKRKETTNKILIIGGLSTAIIITGVIIYYVKIK